MSDTKVRELQRRALRGDPRAEAQLLVERLRVGDLARSRLVLAAVLGHLPARAALEAPGPGTPWDLPVIAAWGSGVVVRAVLADVHRRNRPRSPRLDACEQWAACPCDAHLAMLRELASGLVWTEHYNLTKLIVSEPSREANRRMLSYLVVRIDYRWDSSLPRDTVQRVCELKPDAHETLAAIRTEVVPWVLGSGDPLRRRLEARAA